MAQNTSNTRTQGVICPRRAFDVREQINKRFTLNWLIQGAAMHMCRSIHHLYREQIDAIDPRLIRLYDQQAIFMTLQNWGLTFALLQEPPARFWRAASRDRTHPFYGHQLLSEFGEMMAREQLARAMQGGIEKGISSWSLPRAVQNTGITFRIHHIERPFRYELVALACVAVSEVWNVPIRRLHARMTELGQTIFDHPRKPRTRAGRRLTWGVAGYSGVVRDFDDQLVIKAQAVNFVFLTHELVKASAELICMHAFAGIDDSTCEEILNTADHIEYEHWMLQSGGELWRRLLIANPPGYDVTRTLMHIARLPPHAVESLVRAVIEDPDWARELIVALHGNGSG